MNGCSQRTDGATAPRADSRGLEDVSAALTKISASKFCFRRSAGRQRLAVSRRSA